MTILIRRAEPTDYEAVRQVFSGPQAVWGSLQLPFPSAEGWREALGRASAIRLKSQMRHSSNLPPLQTRSEISFLADWLGQDREAALP